MNGHAALPNERDFRQVIMVIGPVKKEYVPQAAANDTGKTAIHSEIKHMDVPAATVSFHNVIGDEAGRNDAEHKEQAVRPNRESANKK